MFRYLAVKSPIFLLALGLCLSAVASADSPDSNTLKQWDRYGRQVQTALQAAAQQPEHFLWVDQSSDRMAAVQSGHILIAPLLKNGSVPMQSGLIHHWVGAVFLPGTTAAQFLHSLQDYENYSNIYGPAVTHSRLLSHSEDQFTYSLTIVSKALTIKTGVRCQLQSRFVSGADGVGYSISQSTEIRELVDPGGPREQDIEPDQDHGYLQRILTVVRYREEKAGTLVEMESITLSRSIPSPMRWLAGPIIERISLDAMTNTLDKLRTNFQPLSARATPANKERVISRRSFR